MTFGRWTADQFRADTTPPSHQLTHGSGSAVTRYRCRTARWAGRVEGESPMYDGSPMGPSQPIVLEIR
jgi:hypothetical protein